MATVQNAPTPQETPQIVTDPSPNLPEVLIEPPEAPQNLLLNNTIAAPTGKFQHILMPLILLCIIVVGMSSLVYAYMYKVGPF